MQEFKEKSRQLLAFSNQSWEEKAVYTYKTQNKKPSTANFFTKI